MAEDRTKAIAKPQRRRRPPPGTAPGTLIADPAAPSPAISVIAYGPEAFQEAQVSDPEEIQAIVEKSTVTWINVDGLGDADTIRKLGELFGLHTLALEDVMEVGQRAKVEEYENSQFIVVRMPSSRETSSTEQLSIFLGDKFVVTFQERPGDCFAPVRERIRKGRRRIRNSGPDYLLYALLDAVIDGYFPLVEHCGGRLQDLEGEALSAEGEDTIARIFEVRQALLTLRPVISSHRDLVNQLRREDTSLVEDEIRVYLRDVHDHSLQLLELADRYRELGAGMTELYLSVVSNRMNEVMKVLTIIATIFIPLTFIAGIYGMNFSSEASPWNLPELNWYLGYPLCLVVMAVIAAALVGFFRRKRWI